MQDSGAADTQLIVNRFMAGYSVSAYESLGCITEISYYNDVLTQAEVNDLYNDGKAKDADEASGNGNLVGYWRNNGLAEWKDRKGSNDANTNSVTETILQQAGVDASRDCQGFLMNRQKDTNALNLASTNEATGDLTVNNYVSIAGNPITLTNDFSVSMWIKIHKYYAAGTQSIISLADDNGNHFELGIIVTNKLIGSLETSTTGLSRWKQSSSNADIAVDTWAHVVCCISSGVSTGNNSATLVDSGAAWPIDELIGGRVWDDTDNQGAIITDNTATVVTGALSGSDDWDTDDKYTITKCYINKDNETLDIVDSGSGIDTTDGESLYLIGSDNAAQRQFTGLIDDVLIYENKWLTLKEITRIYNAGKRSHR